MQVSKDDLSKQVEKKIFKALYQSLLDLKNVDQMKKFLEDVLSETERVVIAKRLGIAWMLHQGKSYDAIKNSLKVSSATIANISVMVDNDNQGLKLALKSIEADEWATQVTGKITRSVKKALGGR